MPKHMVEEILVKTLEDEEKVKEVSSKVNIPNNLEMPNQQSNHFYIQF